jgi:hypothetical protein
MRLDNLASASKSCNEQNRLPNIRRIVLPATHSNLASKHAASEGFDLQNFCSRLIHYEIPWNPNRMDAEQRQGGSTWSEG